jgi:hypothetical protein
MERRDSSTIRENKKTTDRIVDILCDHQDSNGECCNKHSIYIITYEDSDFPIYTCEKCVYMYMDEGSDCRYLND